jgi:NADH-quinone oxidoreductase subunit H
VFFVCAFAETNRLPFDFAEGESEIVAGFLTEFSDMKMGLLWLSEYIHMITASALIVTLYFGGWHIPFVDDPSLILGSVLGSVLSYDMVAILGPILGAILSLVCFGAKLLFFCWMFIWVRWTLPRFRYDQLMSLGWKAMMPLGFANLLLCAWLVYRAVA